MEVRVLVDFLLHIADRLGRGETERPGPASE